MADTSYATPLDLARQLDDQVRGEVYFSPDAGVTLGRIEGSATYRALRAYFDSASQEARVESVGVGLSAPELVVQDAGSEIRLRGGVFQIAYSTGSLSASASHVFYHGGFGGADVFRIRPSSIWITPQPDSAGGPYPLIWLNAVGATHTGIVGAVETIDAYFNIARLVTFAGGVTLPSQRAFVVTAPTYAATVPMTITAAATMAVSGPPNAGVGMSITDTWALWVQSGQLAIPDGTGSRPSLTFASDSNTGLRSGGADAITFVTGAWSVADLNQWTFKLSPRAITSGSGAQAFWINAFSATHTNLSAENNDVYWDFNRIVTFTGGGAIATQRAFLVTPPTYAAAAARTITDAATVAISGVPVAGTNMTLTNSYALWVGGNARFDATVFKHSATMKLSPLSDSTTALAVANATLTNYVVFDSTNQRVRIGSAVAPSYTLDVTGTAHISGKLTVDGAIDPPSILLSGGSTALYFESNDGSTAPVSGAATGRIRYNNLTGLWQVSTQGGTYWDIATLQRPQTFTAAQVFSSGITVGGTPSLSFTGNSQLNQISNDVSVAGLRIGAVAPAKSFLLDVSGIANTLTARFSPQLATVDRTYTFPDGSGTVIVSGVGSAGGQTIVGGTASGENLTLQSTSHATKGAILFGTSRYDEVNNRLGLAITPETRLDVSGSGLFRPVTPGVWSSGAGLRVSYDSGNDCGELLAYNITAAAFKELRLRGSFIKVLDGGLIVDNGQNLGVGQASPSFSGGTNAIFIQNGTNPGTITNGCSIYCRDVAASSEIFVQDEGGNETQLSTHNKNGDWVFYSRNLKTGRTVYVNMEKFIRRMEEVTGEKFIFDRYLEN